MQSSQRTAKLRDRICVRQDPTHISQCVVDADAAQSRAVERDDGECAALRLYAVDQHGAAFAAQLLDRAHGVEQYAVKVLVHAGLVDQADIDLFCAIWQVGLADPAQRQDGIDTVEQRPQSADVAEPDAVIVRITTTPVS